MAILTPGLDYLGLFVARSVLPPIVFTHTVLSWLSIPGSGSDGIYWICLVLSLPVSYYLNLLRIWIIEELELRELGAVRVPEVKGRWPGNLDLLLGRLKQGKDGYPLESLEGLTRKYGKILTTKIMGMNRIVTVDPGHMKAMLATDFQDWEKGPSFRHQNGSVLGSGVFNMTETCGNFTVS
ncbi:hypothetical protein B0H21DRAFT_500380 [Amylocystis lapponica]|nr:hypothetical protein B0H21DRAFT_500380 [Amylocystis lapponica]